MLETQEKWVRFLGQEDSPGEENGNTLQFYSLGNPMDRGAWRATVQGSQRVRPNYEYFRHGTICLLPSARANLLLPAPQQLPRQGLGRDESAPDLRQASVETPPACMASGACLAISLWEGRGGLDGVVVRVLAPSDTRVLISEHDYVTWPRRTKVACETLLDVDPRGRSHTRETSWARASQ